ncbi:BFD domain protein (2Fe-2S)-binding domain protein [Desulforamulus hydrothermalis]|uniref:BFD domain protein (2Fe-2S)-binding domain protein n=1 Tax=Desulforamulus hydrothermalis Lam5 = DSM 18033 TaxID=1121428 RepID=K8E6H0_9FIRM|nr:BFD domain protein (2Fe-2S)-binding domain protein [Desulforamulus hydrothermalis]CCO07078.1 BFD domain protein (2Fe-2S)-binding domain protein [Desulforamulus hydrothermalis Lam5 = DSM 18033]SHH40798.1 hypothetical protein SAMN02745177_02453 [Desulforamulus hydrothermalis Lam5 = DSM 18033]
MTIVCGVPTQEKSAACPVCGSGGKPMQPATLQSLIKEDYLPEQLTGYSMCLNASCPVVYFGQAIIYKESLKVKVWFKESDPAVPVCYCSNVSTRDIFEHIKVKQCCHNLKDIQEHTGANTGKQCLLKNPAGT